MAPNRRMPNDAAGFASRYGPLSCSHHRGFRRWASTRPVSRPSRQPAIGLPGNYPDRTHTGRRRRASAQAMIAGQSPANALGARNFGLNRLRTLTARVSLKRGGSWRPPASPPARSCGPTAACPDFSPRDRPQGRESARTAALVSISTTRCVQPTEVASCSRYGVTMLKFGSGGSSTARIDGSASASPVTSMPGESVSPAAKANSRSLFASFSVALAVVSSAGTLR